jgi:large subunit ribosomal protein L34e
MVPHKTKSRTFARKNRVTVRGTKRVYTRRKPSLGTCSVTGQTLKGVPRELPVKLRNMPKTKKRPSRPFGGVLSSKAAREEIKSRARKLEL